MVIARKKINSAAALLVFLGCLNYAGFVDQDNDSRNKKMTTRVRQAFVVGAIGKSCKKKSPIQKKRKSSEKRRLEREEEAIYRRISDYCALLARNYGKWVARVERQSQPFEMYDEESSDSLSESEEFSLPTFICDYYDVSTRYRY